MVGTYTKLLTFWVKIYRINTASVFIEMVKLLHSINGVERSIKPPLEHYILFGRFAAGKCQSHLAINYF